jgi:hypothetical protein
MDLPSLFTRKGEFQPLDSTIVEGFDDTRRNLYDDVRSAHAVNIAANDALDAASARVRGLMERGVDLENLAVKVKPTFHQLWLAEVKGR